MLGPPDALLRRAPGPKKEKITDRTLLLASQKLNKFRRNQSDFRAAVAPNETTQPDKGTHHIGFEAHSADDLHDLEWWIGTNRIIHAPLAKEITDASIPGPGGTVMEHWQLGKCLDTPSPNLSRNRAPQTTAT